MDRIYLDHNATTPVLPEVFEAMIPFLGNQFGNPSSAHKEGIYARTTLDHCRMKVARLLDVSPTEVIFTSSATESNNLVLQNILQNKPCHLITTKVEHPSVRNVAKSLEKWGCDVTFLSVDRYGVCDLKQLEAAIKPTTSLVSVIYANNETGTISPIKEIGEITKRHGIAFHSDAVQSVGKIPINLKNDGITFLSLSGHKFGAPKGIGILVAKKTLSPLLYGGGQEFGMRSGTENIPYVVGITKALEVAFSHGKENFKKFKTLKGILINDLETQLDNVIVHGHPTNVLPTTLAVSFIGIACERLLYALDDKGIAISTGSACGVERGNLSPVLTAMGVKPDIIKSMIRISFGEDMDLNTLKKVSSTIVQTVRELRC